MIRTQANYLEFNRHRAIQNRNIQEHLLIRRLQLHVYRYIKRHDLIESVSVKSLDMIHAYREVV